MSIVLLPWARWCLMINTALIFQHNQICGCIELMIRVWSSVVQNVRWYQFLQLKIPLLPHFKMLLYENCYLNDTYLYVSISNKLKCEQKHKTVFDCLPLRLRRYRSKIDKYIGVMIVTLLLIQVCIWKHIKIHQIFICVKIKSVP